MHCIVGAAILATCKFIEVNTKVLGHVMGGVLEGGCGDVRVSGLS